MLKHSKKTIPKFKKCKTRDNMREHDGINYIRTSIAEIYQKDLKGACYMICTASLRARRLVTKHLISKR